MSHSDTVAGGDLLGSSETVRQLAARHLELDRRLHELANVRFLSPAEQAEEQALKKQKLRLKDELEFLRHHPERSLTH